MFVQLRDKKYKLEITGNTLGIVMRKNSCPVPIDEESENFVEDYFRTPSKRSLQMGDRRHQAIQAHTDRSDIPLVTANWDDSKFLKNYICTFCGGGSK